MSLMATNSITCRDRNMSAPNLFPDNSITSMSRINNTIANKHSYPHISMTPTFSSPKNSVTFELPNESCSEDDLVTINVSGRRYQTYLGTLHRFPDSLLGDPKKRKHFYNKKTGEYFFDRHRKAFDGILYYYQSNGTVACPPGVPENIFTQEIFFFELGKSIEEPEEEFGEEFLLPKNPVLAKIWVLFEKPNSSLPARIVAVFSIVIIILSITIFCLETLPEPTDDAKKSKLRGIWRNLNTICNVWFTFEYVMRLFAAPRKWVFMKSTVNMIDLLSIIPFYLTLIIGEHRSESIEGLQVIRVIRVIRIFKLTRHSRGLHVLANTIKASFQELVMLVLFLAIAVILFASAVYFAEQKTDENKFKSIPHSFWWAVITMTTVGYGDLTPRTLIGQLVGTLCAVSGVLVIALPVPVIVSNFEYFYKEEQNRQAREDEITKKKTAEQAFRDMRKSLQLMTSTSIILAGGLKRKTNEEIDKEGITNTTTSSTAQTTPTINEAFQLQQQQQQFYQGDNISANKEGSKRESLRKKIHNKLILTFSQPYHESLQEQKLSQQDDKQQIQPPQYYEAVEMEKSYNVEHNNVNGNSPMIPLSQLGLDDEYGDEDDAHIQISEESMLAPPSSPVQNDRGSPVRKFNENIKKSLPGYMCKRR